MRHSKATLAVIAALVATMSLPVLARGGAGRSGHSFSGARAHSGHAGPHRFFSGPRVGFFVGAPLFAAPFFYRTPGYYDDDYYPPPPPMYIQQPSQPFWYFCPDANGYYPQVQVCPGGWQPVLPEPAGPGPGYPG
jgi:hypothetical protein